VLICEVTVAITVIVPVDNHFDRSVECQLRGLKLGKNDSR